MSTTYYTSLSGMVAASYGLQNTANNVANMQSPGFKRQDVFYSSLSNGYGEEGLGSGVCVNGRATNFSDGKYLETNSPSDLAIVGQGFFVLRMKNGALFYTRNGEFAFDNRGILIDRRSGGEVQGLNSGGRFVGIHEKGPKTVPGRASSEIFLNGQLVLKEKATRDPNLPNPAPDIPDPDPTHRASKYENIKFSVTQVYDHDGKAHEIELEFHSVKELGMTEDGTHWELISATCADAEITLLGSKTIVFNEIEQGPQLEYGSITLLLNNSQPIALRFGSLRDSSNNAVLLKKSALNPEGSKIATWQNDGYSFGKQVGVAFDDNGQITYTYDNGQKNLGDWVALARFDDLEHHLVPTQDNLFRAKSNEGLHIGRANHKGFGSIKSQQVESSNVDSTMEFANIVILQRMFQACSQIMEIDKELLEGLQGT